MRSFSLRPTFASNWCAKVSPIEQLSTYVGKGKDINALFLANPGQGHSHATGETAKLIEAFNAESFKNGRIVAGPYSIHHLHHALQPRFLDHGRWADETVRTRSIDAQRDSGRSTYTIKTANISRLFLSDMNSAHALSIDGDTLAVTAPAATILLTKTPTTGRFPTPPPLQPGLRKQHALQGPVNDAFLDAFICVSPSGTPYSAAANEHALHELDRFDRMFAA